ncbi:septin interacting protein 1 [Dermatophagoides farinae]|uniref:septin interacting protein 1 n=1 Tax=Dermatophagoides farinae TaxID=6954 RepID=UPI003F637EDB
MVDNDDDGFIKFEVSDWDLEFGQGNHRPKRMSKNQAIYGIWAESESDDEDGNRRGKKQSNMMDINKTGVSFVKSDQKLQDELKERKPSSSNHEFSKQTQSKKKPSRFSGLGSSSNNADAEFGQWEMYTKGVGSKLLQKMGYQPGKGLGKNLQGIIEPIEAKKRPGTGSIGLYGPETTAKILRKGANDDDDKKQKKDQDETELSTNEKEWKRNDGTKKKIKTIKVYEKSTDDIIRDSITKSWTNPTADYLNNMKIIDMTGPQQQILSGLTKLHQSKPAKPKDDYHVTKFNTRFDIPELRNNVERLIMLTEKNLVKRKREYDRNSNQMDNLNEERDRLNQLAIVYQRQLKSIQVIETFVESLEEMKHELSFEKGLEKFENFFTTFSAKDESNIDEQKRLLRSLKFDTLLRSIFGPIIRRELRTWHPFDNFAIDYSGHFDRLRRLMSKSKTFEIILWQHWTPIVSRAIQQISLKLQFESIIAFLEKWQKILPKWLYEYFIANNLLPKMRSEVDEWNPLTDTISIHSWIHPWLPVLLTTTKTTNTSENELNFLFEPIYEIIRSKLANALKNWHPSDCSARLILEPWKNVFTESSMQSFLEMNIVPKLEQSMQQMQINPNQQSLNEWNWTIQWSSLLSTNTIVSILEHTFFPKWLNVLYVWLNSGVANFQEISSWYQGWKTLMGNDLINHIIVKEFLRKALIMMDHAVNLETGLKSFTSYYDPNVGITVNQQQPATTTTTTMMQPPVPPSIVEDKINFRQMIEIKAAEYGILFMPMANRFENGHQIFKFGSSFIYIDNQVIFQNRVQSNGHRLWIPVSLSDLLINSNNN